MLPEGWTNTKFASGFTSSREKGSLGLPTLSVTIYGGLVDRDSIDRKMDTNLDPNEHLLVRKGDIAYNMMRMWQGASGLAEHNALVSPAYVVLRAKKGMDPLFASYLFKLRHMIHQFWAYSYGLTDDRLRLYPKDFGMIPVILPPIAEQRGIAEILSTWDQAIAVQERLVANARAQKKALMQTLLTGKKRLPGFKGEWKTRKFSTIASLAKERVDTTSLPPGARGIELEHIESETGSLLGFAEANQQLSLKTPFNTNHVLYGKLRPYLRKFLKPTFSGVASTEIWVLIASRKLCSPEFLYFLVQSPGFEAVVDMSAGSKMPRADWDVVKDAPFLIPELDEQSAISNVLEASEILVRNLQARVRQLQQEKSALMQQLLTGKRRVKVEAQA
jgi:type I restriction enzyme, S subunit